MLKCAEHINPSYRSDCQAGERCHHSKLLAWPATWLGARAGWHYSASVGSRLASIGDRVWLAGWHVETANITYDHLFCVGVGWNTLLEGEDWITPWPHAGYAAHKATSPTGHARWTILRSLGLLGGWLIREATQCSCTIPSKAASRGLIGGFTATYCNYPRLVSNCANWSLSPPGLETVLDETCSAFAPDQDLLLRRVKKRVPPRNPGTSRAV